MSWSVFHIPLVVYMHSIRSVVSHQPARSLSSITHVAFATYAISHPHRHTHTRIRKIYIHMHIHLRGCFVIAYFWPSNVAYTMRTLFSPFSRKIKINVQTHFIIIIISGSCCVVSLFLVYFDVHCICFVLRCARKYFTTNAHVYIVHHLKIIHSFSEYM